MGSLKVTEYTCDWPSLMARWVEIDIVNAMTAAVWALLLLHLVQIPYQQPSNSKRLGCSAGF